MTDGTAPLLWSCAVHAPKLSPERRLAVALEMALERGLPIARVHVNAAIAAGTTPPDGTELVASRFIPRDHFRFETVAR